MSKKTMLAMFIASSLAIGGCDSADKQQDVTTEKKSLLDYIVVGGLLVGCAYKATKIIYDHNQYRCGKRDEPA